MLAVRGGRESPPGSGGGTLAHGDTTVTKRRNAASQRTICLCGSHRGLQLFRWLSLSSFSTVAKRNAFCRRVPSGGICASGNPYAWPDNSQARKTTRSHLINGAWEDTASAVPKSCANSGVLTPEVRMLVTRSIYEVGSRQQSRSLRPPPLAVSHGTNFATPVGPHPRICYSRNAQRFRQDT